MTSEEKKQLQHLVEKYLNEDAYKPRGWGKRAAEDFHNALCCEWLQSYCFFPDPVYLNADLVINQSNFELWQKSIVTRTRRS